MRLHNSCGSRYCPQCQGGRRLKWLERTRELMLPVHHFQVVFTLPSELRPLAAAIPYVVYSLLFEASSYVLQTLARQRMDARLAILTILHTWDRQLRLHPHVHCVVSAGGLRDDGTWIDTRRDFLFHHPVMQKMFQGYFIKRLQEALDKEPELAGRHRGKLKRLRKELYRKRWVVFVEAPEEREPQILLKYLASYVYQTAISDHRLLAIKNDKVTLRTRGKATVTMPGAELVRRFTHHFLPYRFRKVRHYGLLAPSNRSRLATARELLPAPDPPPEPEPPDSEQQEESPDDERLLLRCPFCGGPIVATALPADPAWDPCIPWLPPAWWPP